jgi:NADPH:quinone reductase
MFAHKIVDFTGPAAVQWTQVNEPVADGGVVIDVVAAGVSFADLLQTIGAYQLKVPLPFTPGMDAAGTVRSARPELGLAAGQRVAVLLSYGCWQEVISAPPERVLALPDDLSFEAAAALPLNYLTALLALVRRGRAQPGETLLVHGAAGGVGTAAIQLGRALGLRTIAVVGDEAKQRFAVASGADHAVLASGWLAAVRDLVGERAVDLVVDPVGGDRMTDSLRALAPGGAAGPGLRRRGDSHRQGQPAPAGQYRGGWGGLPGALRPAAGGRGGAVGAAVGVAADWSVARSAGPAVPVRGCPRRAGRDRWSPGTGQGGVDQAGQGARARRAAAGMTDPIQGGAPRPEPRVPTRYGVLRRVPLYVNPAEQLL